MGSMLHFLLVAVLALAAIHGVDTSTRSKAILALPMMAGVSPGLDVMAVAGELQQRGYDILAAVPDTDTDHFARANSRHQQEHQRPDITPGRLSFITMHLPSGGPRVLAKKIFASSNHSSVPFRQMLPNVRTVLTEACEYLVNNATAMQIIRDAKPELVLSLFLPMGSDDCGCIMSHALGVPYVLVDGLPMIKGPITLPQLGSGLTKAEVRTPLGFLKNAFYWARNHAVVAVLGIITNRWPAVRQAGRIEPASHYGGCHPAVVLMLKSPVLEYPQRLPPGAIMLGGTSGRPAHSGEHQRRTQPEVWDFLEESDPTAGVVLVGFGSTGIFGMTLKAEDYHNLAAAFSDLAPTRVIWALLPTNLPSGVRLEDLPMRDNVKVVPWVDYNDVLGHPAAKVFISHCGYHSITEAAFHGVPVIGVPFMFEQLHNARLLASRGMGEVNQEAVAFRARNKSLTYQRATMRDLVRKVLDDPSYRAAAAKLSRKTQLYYSFRPPIARAADEIEVLLSEDGLEQQQQQQQQQAPEAAAEGGENVHGEL